MSTPSAPTDIRDAGAQALVNDLLASAVRERASDLHLESVETGLRLRLRVDGVARELPPLTLEQRPAVLAALKAMAGLNLAEKRLPQDGRCQLRVAERPLDLRVSTVPAIHGECVTVRFLDARVVQLRLDQVIAFPDTLAAIRELVARPYGMVLANGPTGSGKTTLLYAMLRELDQASKVIFTIEDPVEYALPGINQLPVQAAIGLTYGRLLRSIMRHDPDVILVSEIRDLETLQVAIQAAMTGHLVLASLHTQDGPSALRRFLDLGVDPFLLRSAMLGVVSQRLLRKLCEACKRQEAVPAGLPEVLQAALRAAGISQVWQAVGCPACHQNGYRGRLAINEVLRPGPACLAAVDRRADGHELRAAARADGWRDLLADGLRLVQAGKTTVDELIRVCPNPSDG